MGPSPAHLVQSSNVYTLSPQNGAWTLVGITWKIMTRNKQKNDGDEDSVRSDSGG